MVTALRFGNTWWGRAWVDALEGAGSGYDSRLPRGRTYARKGAVRALQLLPGHIASRVVGRSGEIYDVDIAVRRLADSEWEQIAEAIAARAAHLAALLDGELHPGILDDASEMDVRLLPGAIDLRPDCSCPDWAEPCKHAAATCYVVAERLDEDPFALMLLRGVERDALIDMVRSQRAGAELTDANDVESPAGVDATEAWSTHELADPLAPPPDSVGHASSNASLAHPGRCAPWDLDAPKRSGIDTRRVDELAEDAIGRAWSMLVYGAPSGLAAGPLADLARRAAEQPDRLVELASLAGVAVLRLRAWAEAWQIGGDVAVQVVTDPDTWCTDQDLLDAGRAELIELGHARRSVALNYDSLRMAHEVWLVIGPDRRWYRLHGAGKHQDLQLVSPPENDLRDLVEPA